MPRFLGRHAQVTWTPGTGGEDFRRSATSNIVLDAVALRENWDAKLRSFRPLGDAEDDFESFGSGGSFFLRMEVESGGEFQMPSNIRATLRVYDFAGDTYREGEALIQRAAWDAQGAAGSPQQQWYTARWCGAVTAGEA